MVVHSSLYVYMMITVEREIFEGLNFRGFRG